MPVLTSPFLVGLPAISPGVSPVVLALAAAAVSLAVLLGWLVRRRRAAEALARPRLAPVPALVTPPPASEAPEVARIAAAARAAAELEAADGEGLADGDGAAGGDEPESRELRVLRRQVAVLMATLEEWDGQRPGPTPAPAPATIPVTITPVSTEPLSTEPSGAGGETVDDLPVGSTTGPAVGPAVGTSGGPTVGTAYAHLSRRLAATGDLSGAVLAQWASDLEVLRGPLGPRGPELADALHRVSGADPLGLLRACRETALALTATDGPVRALLAPLDHLAAAPLPPAPLPVASHPRVPLALVDAAPPAQQPALRALLDRSGTP